MTSEDTVSAVKVVAQSKGLLYSNTPATVAAAVGVLPVLGVATRAQGAVPRRVPAKFGGANEGEVIPCALARG